MEKFEPGDLVIGNIEAGDEYSITETDTIWEVLKCDKDHIWIGIHFTFDPNGYQEFDVDDQFFDKLPFKLGDIITFASYAGSKFKVISLAPYDGPDPYNRIKLCNLSTNEEKYYDTTEINFMAARVVAPADLQQSSFNIEDDDRDLL